MKNTSLSTWNMKHGSQIMDGRSEMVDRRSWISNVSSSMFQVPRKGFTFIEILIVLGIISITLPIVFSLLFINLRAQSRISQIQLVKRNGDYALAAMESLIKNYAYEVVDGSNTVLCNNTGSNNLNANIHFLAKDEKHSTFSFYSTSGRIASLSAVILDPNTSAQMPVHLTDETTKVVVKNLNFKCQGSGSYNPPVISISFDIGNAASASIDPSVRGEDKVSFHYQTKVKLNQ